MNHTELVKENKKDVLDFTKVDSCLLAVCEVIEESLEFLIKCNGDKNA